MKYEFRGKREKEKGGDWVYGNLMEFPDGDMRIGELTEIPYLLDQYPVDPETVSQYIWQDDMHGKHIFEGDILKHVSGRLYLVGWCESCSMYAIECITDDRKSSDFTIHSGGEFEIVGNRYDNPELLEVEQHGNQLR